MTNDEAATHFDRRELLAMCRDKIAAGEANDWMKAYYVGNRHLEPDFPSLAELKSPVVLVPGSEDQRPEGTNSESLPTAEQF